MDITDEPPERSRAARRASKTRERLMGAALSVINARGFDGCSIEDITELADVGKGTFYRHFKDKSVILRDLLDDASRDLIERMQTRRRQAVSLETAVSSIVGSHVEAFMARPDLFLLFLQGQHMAATRPAATPGLDTSFEVYFAEIEKIMQPFLSPEVSEVTRRRLSLAASAAIGGFVTTALSGGRTPQEIGADLNSVTQAFVAGIPRLLL